MKERMGYIDTSKGILIIMMLLGHIWNNGILHDLIYAFHMPSFFIIAGILFRYSSSINGNLISILFIKFKRLLIPYLFFEVFAIIVHITQHGMTLNIKGYIFEIMMLHLFNGPLWFLFVMFVAEVLFILLYKCQQKISKKYNVNNKIVLIVLFLIVVCLPKFQQYINITTITMSVFFLMIGFVFYKEFAKRNSIKAVVLLFLVTFFISILNRGVGMPDYQDGYRILYVISAITGSYVVLQIGHRVSVKSFIFYGKNSIILLGSHYPIIRIFKSAFSIDEFDIYTGLLFFILMLVLEVFLIYGINYICPFVVGKSYVIHKK